MDEERRRNMLICSILITILEWYTQTIILMLDLINIPQDNLLVPSRQPSNRVTINNYLETVNLFSDQQFQENFRLTRTAYDKLESIFRAYFHHNCIIEGRQIKLRTQILSTLWLLGTPDSYRSISERFGLNKGVLYRCVLRIVKILCKISGNIIKWPTEIQQNRIKREFLRSHGIPGVIGAVDGTFIFCSQPKENGNAYNTRKCQHAIQLQAICTNNLKFIDVFAGYPGSVGDYRVFRNSDIYREIEENPLQFFPQDSHILGDKAYPLKTWCITPYRDNGRLTQEQRRFNQIHSSCRCKIEHAFGLLKGRLRRMKKMEIIRHDLAPYYILASCVIHNMCIDIGGEDIARYISDNSEDSNQNRGDGRHSNVTPQQATAAAIDKRNYLCSYANQ